MPAKPAAKPASTEQPPYYIAVEALFIGDQFSRAFNPGDRVPADHVTRYGWHDRVCPPPGYAAPDQPASKPDTPDSGQAPTSEGKDA